MLNKLILLVLLSSIAICLCTLTPTVVPSDYKNNATFIGGNYFLYWNIINDTILDVGIIANNNGWVAMGITNQQGGGMKDSDIIMGRIVGTEFRCEDKWTNAAQPPCNDTDVGGKYNIIDCGGGYIGGKRNFRFRRLLDTQDIKDRIILLKGETQIIVAFNADSDCDTMGHERNHDGGNVDFGKGTVVSVVNWVPIVHGALMVAGWSFLIIFGMGIARYVPKGITWWFPVHIVLQSLGSVCIFVAFILIMIHIKSRGGSYFNLADKIVGSHQIIGLITTGAVFFQIIIGIISDRVWQKKFKDLGGVPPVGFWDVFHWWVGRLSLLLSIANVFLGLYLFGAGTIFFVLYGIWIGFSLILFIILEVRRCYVRKDGYEMVNSHDQTTF